LIWPRRDPLADPEPLIRRVYAYVAYRLGDGPEAEDVTGDVFERAVRYRASYQPARGEPIAWLIGIARRAIDDNFKQRASLLAEMPETAAPGDLEQEAIQRISLAAEIERLSVRDRELVALRYGADLTAAQIAELLELTTNAVEVGLHRALARLRSTIVQSEDVRV
jgi:RNA polymerase sigma-70 factor (ECF subfamily)